MTQGRGGHNVRRASGGCCVHRPRSSSGRATVRSAVRRTRRPRRRRRSSHHGSWIPQLPGACPCRLRPGAERRAESARLVERPSCRVYQRPFCVHLARSNVSARVSTGEWPSRWSKLRTRVAGGRAKRCPRRRSRGVTPFSTGCHPTRSLSIDRALGRVSSFGSRLSSRRPVRVTVGPAVHN